MQPGSQTKSVGVAVDGGCYMHVSPLSPGLLRVRCAISSGAASASTPATLLSVDSMVPRLSSIGRQAATQRGEHACHRLCRSSLRCRSSPWRRIRDQQDGRRHGAEADTRRGDGGARALIVRLIAPPRPPRCPSPYAGSCADRHRLSPSAGPLREASTEDLARREVGAAGAGRYSLHRHLPAPVRPCTVTTAPAAIIAGTLSPAGEALQRLPPGRGAAPAPGWSRSGSPPPARPARPGRSADARRVPRGGRRRRRGKPPSGLLQIAVISSIFLMVIDDQAWPQQAVARAHLHQQVGAGRTGCGRRARGRRRRRRPPHPASAA